MPTPQPTTVWVSSFGATTARRTIGPGYRPACRPIPPACHGLQPGVAREWWPHLIRTRILRGANPGDLPVELPTRFDYVLSHSTVEALGLTIPPNVESQVTEWVE